ncbi:hypothetical protein VOLCADRAFT_100566 [Volvox carteri f. nagariensis]|uniref:Uncharacterized protein n=1 Tax=Volvox carteri f. nagariensis TaxID=3068 RepID=D8UKI1_VOLCA|nr:uncharacterized protein VOLCADRAFT_100566 [Volvox carteri f. nagariensis]EFJ39762.1 hypothetical protein VOLCADRAFT_100566 [Volvox carteri f. nagariensis]|eukprot:XP_002959172.1 hypothetical protein VOLCADRAFT_100566 [Volvox carteri f. nagariensis]
MTTGIRIRKADRWGVVGHADRPASAFLTTISASKGLPPIELPQSTSDYYSDLVTVSSKVYGEVKKSGPLPAERYAEKLFNQSAFRDWLLLKVENVTVPAPMSYRCGVFVNHDYKLIFIRNRKAASTTVLDTFKTACKSQKVMCMKHEIHGPARQADTMTRKTGGRGPWGLSLVSIVVVPQPVGCFTSRRLRRLVIPHGVTPHTGERGVGGGGGGQLQDDLWKGESGRPPTLPPDPASSGKRCHQTASAAIAAAEALADGMRSYCPSKGRPAPLRRHHCEGHQALVVQFQWLPEGDQWKAICEDQKALHQKPITSISALNHTLEGILHMITICGEAVQIWDAGDLEIVRTLSLPIGGVVGFVEGQPEHKVYLSQVRGSAATEDGARAVVIAQSNCVVIFDITGNTPKVMHTPRAPGKLDVCAISHAAGRVAATSGEDGALYGWDIKTGKLCYSTKFGVQGGRDIIDHDKGISYPR